jgi:DNA-binding NarL/FixJ family response regulator
MDNMAIKVAITDDHFLVLSGLKASLKGMKRVVLIGAYTSGEALLEGLQVDTPDVLLLDLQMPGLSGTTLVYAIRKQWPEIRIIIVTGAEDISYVRELLNSGCRGYLLKGAMDKETLTEAIDQVCNGAIFVTPSLKDELFYDVLNIKKGKAQGVPKLTRREAETLKLVSKGLSSQQIAEELFLSIRTIDSHRLSLLKKLNASNTATLLKKATGYGLI